MLSRTAEEVVEKRGKLNSKTSWPLLSVYSLHIREKKDVRMDAHTKYSGTQIIVGKVGRRQYNYQPSVSLSRIKYAWSVSYC